MNSGSLSCALITSLREDHMQASGGRKEAIGDENPQPAFLALSGRQQKGFSDHK